MASAIILQGAVASPESVALALPPGVALAFNMADFEPDVVGLKTTWAVQLAPPASVAPQVVELIEKSPGLVPPSVMARLDVVPTAVDPVFET